MALVVLFVCTGNICRSPMAEALFRARIAPDLRGQIHAFSAGTHGLVGRPIDAVASAALKELGVEADGHRAERTTPGMAVAADLVLTATSEHRREILAREPAARGHTFTMREFVRVGRGLPDVRPGPAGNRWANRIADVAQQRESLDPPRPGEDEIGDPFGAPMIVMQRCASIIDDTVGEIVRILGLD